MRLARKKGAQVQLQAEINTSEEWEKLLEKEGLIVVDIYSEWCGPCIGMVGNLKKLKVEVGGDNLHLAIAKADGIDCLKRFRKKSEPTWMFIAGGNIVNLMFGADAPRLTRLIIEELKYEAQAQNNERERVQIPFDQLTPAEQARKSILDGRLTEIAEIEKLAAKAAAAERRRKRCELMAPFIAELDVLLFWPHAFDGHKMIYEAWIRWVRSLEISCYFCISVADKESPKLNEEQINGLFFENEEILENEAAINILLEKACLAILLKINPEKGDILEKVKKVVYEDVTKCEKPPAAGEDADKEEEVFQTVADKLELKKDEDTVIPGIYSPTDPISKAAAINILFPKTIAQFVEPEVPPLPPHVAVVYDAFKRREVLEACAANEKDVLKLGFFASGDLQNVKNIGITLEEYENIHQQKEYGEKLVVMLSKTNCDTMLEFVELGPTYISPNAVEGAKECSVFFPPGYGEKPKEVVTKVKKKKGKKRVDPNKVTSAEKVDTEMSEKTAEQSIATEVEENGDRIESDDGMENLETEEVECGDDEASPEGEDKATSPIQDGE